MSFDLEDKKKVEKDPEPEMSLLMGMNDDISPIQQSDYSL
jgi:hypothetical protein